MTIVKQASRPPSALFARVRLWERIEVRDVQMDVAFGMPLPQPFQTGGRAPGIAKPLISRDAAKPYPQSVRNPQEVNTRKSVLGL